MTDDTWQAAWKVYETASEMPERERTAYVRSALSDPEAVDKVLEFLGGGNEPAPVQPDDAAEGVPVVWAQLGKSIGRFRITGVLGRGGGGEVYAAEDTELQRTVALKFVGGPNRGGERSLSPRSMEHFTREARAAS